MRAKSHATYPDLNNKVALILGIGQSRACAGNAWGNGAAIALVLSQSGVKLYGCDIDLDNAEYTAERIRQDGGICDVMEADVTSSTDIQKVVNAVMTKYSRIDILVNNVGMMVPGNAATLSEETWDKQLDLNLKSVYLSCNKVLPIMEKQQFGSVINNASIAGIRYLGKPQAAYSAAKAAVIHFTKVTALEFAPKGIRLNCIAPGFMYVPLVEKLGHSNNEGDREAFEAIMQHNVPMRTMGSAFDVANAAAFLSSDCAKYITGQALVVDGGLTGSTGTAFKA
jgi:NAD(P)-dependent dehydrogenase (short-subunit alcohol dehydrogenase family)